MSEALTVLRRPRSGAAVLEVSGEIDGFTAPLLQDAIDTVLAEQAGGPEPRGVRLDLTGVEFLNSSGIPVLTESTEAARRAGVAFEITLPPGGRVARTLEITGVAHLLPITPGGA